MTSDNTIDYLGLFSFMLYVLAKYPYETDSVVGVGWRFLDLQVPTFASYVVGKYEKFPQHYSLKHSTALITTYL